VKKLLLLALLIGGYHGSLSAATQENSVNPICSAQNFDKFLSTFANDIEVQKKFIVLPLQSDSVDAMAEPEPKTVTKMLDLSALHFPLMPSTRKQINDGLKLSYKRINVGEVEVKLVKDDTDYQMTFFFRNDGCWKLYRINNDSL